MRKTLCASALVALALLGAGCKKESPIVGKWTSKTQMGSLDFEFKPENTFTMAVKVAGREIDFSGDYKMEGEKLTITPKDVNVPGLGAAEIAKAKTQMSSQLGKSSTLTAKFPTNDQLSLASDGKGASVVQSTTLTRVKESG